MNRGRGAYIADAITMLTELPQRREFGVQDVVRAFEREPDPVARRQAHRWMEAMEAHGLIERVRVGVWRCRFRLVREARRETA